MSIGLMKTLLAFSALFYLSSAILSFLKKKKISACLGLGALLLNLSAVVGNFINNGYVPFVSMYQVLAFLGVCFTFADIYTVFVCKDSQITPYFRLCSFAVMMGCCFMDATAIWHFVPALQSVWFVPHVFCYMLSYSLCTVASVLSAVRYFYKNREDADKGIYRLVTVAFPFMTAGMLMGAVWANEVWTEFWSWDAKENWALITWLCYSLYLHCLKWEKLKKYAYVFNILGFFALFMAFQGVNIFGTTGVHSYS